MIFSPCNGATTAKTVLSREFSLLNPSIDGAFVKTSFINNFTDTKESGCHFSKRIGLTFSLNL